MKENPLKQIPADQLQTEISAMDDTNAFLDMLVDSCKEICQLKTRLGLGVKEEVQCVVLISLTCERGSPYRNLNNRKLKAFNSSDRIDYDGLRSAIGVDMMAFAHSLIGTNN